MFEMINIAGTVAVTLTIGLAAVLAPRLANAQAPQHPAVTAQPGDPQASFLIRDPRDAKADIRQQASSVCEAAVARDLADEYGTEEECTAATIKAARIRNADPILTAAGTSQPR